MGNMARAIKLQLAACNGGPGLTAEELAVRLGSPVAVVRTELSALVFASRDVTCIADGKRAPGRYKLGSSERLRMVGR